MKATELCAHCGRPRSGTRVRCACVPAHVWSLAEAQAAVGARDVGGLLTVLREHTALSQTALARMSGLSQSTVSKLLSGQVDLQHRGRIDAALAGLGAPAGEKNRPAPSTERHALLGASDSVLRHAGLLWKSDLDDAQPKAPGMTPEQLSTASLRWLVNQPVTPAERRPQTDREVTEAHVHAIARTCDIFTALDHEFGGGHARMAAVQYLHSEVAPLLIGQYTLEVGRNLYAASARFTAKVGAMAYDAGLHPLARHYFVHSLSLANLGADRLLGAKALALLSHQANLLGQASTALDLARTAQAGTVETATPAIRAMLAAMEARALATLGDETACTRALHRMEEAFHHTGVEDPVWMSYFDASEVADEIAHCQHDLNHGGAAIDHAYRSKMMAPPNLRRSRTFAGLIQASAHLRTANADPDAACALARTAVVEAGHLRSARVRTYITRLRSDLAPYAALRSVREFEEFLAEAPLVRS